MNVESRNAATDPSIARFREDSRRVKILEKISSLEPTNDDDGVEKLEFWLLAPTLFFLFERGEGGGKEKSVEDETYVAINRIHNFHNRINETYIPSSTDRRTT